MSAPTTRTIRGDGVDLAAIERGPTDAPVIVLVHGYPDSQLVWTKVAEILAARYHVVTYDVRGAGESDKPREREAYSLAHLARDLEAVIDAVSPGKPAHVVGHDWGSIQSWEAVTEPCIAAKIASYTTISGPCIDHAGCFMREGPRAAVAKQSLSSWYIGVMHAASGVPGVWGALMSRIVPRVQRISEGIRRDPDREATLASDASYGMNMYTENMRRHVRAPRLRTTKVPVQLVLAMNDAYVTPTLAAHAERFVETMFRREVPGGHWQPLTHPDDVARWIEEMVRHVEEPEKASDPSFARLQRVHESR